MLVLRDIFFTLMLFLCMGLVFSDINDTSNTEIIDIKIKESCLDDNIWTGYEIVKNHNKEFI